MKSIKYIFFTFFLCMIFLTVELLIMGNYQINNRLDKIIFQNFVGVFSSAKAENLSPYAKLRADSF